MSDAVIDLVEWLEDMMNAHEMAIDTA